LKSVGSYQLFGFIFYCSKISTDMNILKGVAEAFLGNEDEQKTKKFEKLEEPEAILTPNTKEVVLKEEVVQQSIKPIETTEIQPVIQLERELTEVHEVIQPVKETEILPTKIEEKRLKTIEKEEIRQSDEEFKKQYSEVTEGLKSTTNVEQIQREELIKAPIVKETVHKKVIEEVQPVIHKETLVPKVIKEVQPIHEKVVEAPILVTEDFENKPNLEELKKQGVEVESIEKKPVIEDTLKPVETVEVQPVVSLEREQTEIHNVIMPLREKEVLPASYEEKILPTIEREVIQSGEQFNQQYQQLAEQYQSKLNVESVEHVKVLKAPIVQEVIHKKIIEEIQPVIQKETILPHVIHEILPVHERLVEAPILVKEVLPEKDLGITLIEEGIDRSALESKKVA